MIGNFWYNIFNKILPFFTLVFILFSSEAEIKRTTFPLEVQSSCDLALPVFSLIQKCSEHCCSTFDLPLQFSGHTSDCACAALSLTAHAPIPSSGACASSLLSGGTVQCRRRPVAAAPSATQFFTQPEEGGGGEGGELCQVIPGQLPHPSGPSPLSPICWTLESSTELVRRKGGGAQLLVVEDHVQ